MILRKDREKRLLATYVCGLFIMITQPHEQKNNKYKMEKMRV
jgi:hypothetical protein